MTIPQIPGRKVEDRRTGAITAASPQHRPSATKLPSSAARIGSTRPRATSSVLSLIEFPGWLRAGRGFFGEG